MVHCETCGTEDKFKLVEGFYYCIECNTQSQHAVEEEVETNFDNTTGGPPAVRFVRGQTKGKNARKIQKELKDCPRLYLNNEIFHKLVEEVIQIGARYSLKTVALQLWIKYIKVLEMEDGEFGKLPAYCLKEEHAMKINSIKEQTHGMRKIVFNHINMRQNSFMQRKTIKNPWTGYRNVEPTKPNRGGLRDILSDASSWTDSTINEDVSIHGADESMLLSDEEMGIIRSDSAENVITEMSGFGFGGDPMDDQDISFQQSPTKHDEPMATNAPDFSFGEQLSPSASASPKYDTEGTIDITSSVATNLTNYLREKGIKCTPFPIESALQCRTSALLALLYISLILDGSYNIGLSDLVNLVRENALSYCSPYGIFDESLLRARRNLQLASANFPCPAHFLKTGAVLCGLLDLQIIKMPSLQFYVSRMILDINLPRRLIGLSSKIIEMLGLQPVWKLTDREFPFFKCEPLPHMELLAAAIVLFMLKLLFTLDDKKEYEQAKMALHLSQTTGVRHFSITDWLTQFQWKCHVLRRRGVLFTENLKFEHFESVACYDILSHERKRLGFYSRGAVCKSQDFLESLDLANNIKSYNRSISSWFIDDAIKQYVQCYPQHKGLLQDMTHDVIPLKTADVLWLSSRVKHLKSIESRSQNGFPSNFFSIAKIFSDYCYSEWSSLLREIKALENQIIRRRWRWNQ